MSFGDEIANSKLFFIEYSWRQGTVIFSWICPDKENIRWHENIEDADFKKIKSDMFLIILHIKVFIVTQINQSFSQLIFPNWHTGGFY